MLSFAKLCRGQRAVLCSLLSRCRGFARAAESLSPGVRDVEGDSLLNAQFTSRIQNAARRRDWQAAWYEFQHLQDERDTIVYNAIMHAALLCKRFQIGTSLYEEMVERQIRRTLPSYTTAISLYAHRGKHSHADGVWQSMTKKRVHPDGPAYLSMMAAKGKEGDVKRTVQLIGELARSGTQKPKASHFGAVLMACAATRDGKVAQNCMKAMERRGLQANEQHHLYLMRALYGSPLVDVQAYQHETKHSRIQTQDQCLSIVEALLGKRLKTIRTIADLHDVDAARIKATRSALQDLRDLSGSLSELKSLLADLRI